jgi:hypothetical protein
MKYKYIQPGADDLGKGEVVSSILTGSTRNCCEFKDPLPREQSRR